MTTETNGLRIVELRVDNVKCLKAVVIRPDGNMVEITGKNGQGKTSVLDSITYAIGGKNVQPLQPIREGEESASVVLDVGDFIIQRTWKAGGGGVLTIRNSDGAKYSSPQAMLDGFMTNIGFDPLEFTRMAPKDQVVILKQIAGLDFDNIDSLRAGAFEDRTGVNRELKAAQAQLTAMAAPAADTPDEEQSAADLAAEFQAAMEQRRQNQQAQNNLESLSGKIHTERKLLNGRFDAAKCNIERLEEELDSAKRTLSDISEIIAGHDAGSADEVAAAQAAVAAIVDPDVDAIARKVRVNEETNRRVREKKAHVAKADTVKKLQDDSARLTKAIEDFDQQKQDLLLAATMPVQGLAFGENGITLNGLPFDQASSSAKLRVSVAMGLALNPRLKVMLVRDGSLLDSDGRAMLAEMADAAGAQVWMERATDGEAVGIVIEDGEIKAAALAEPLHVDH